MRYFEAVYAKNIFYEKNVYLLIHDLFHDFEIMFDDTKANLELRKLERTYWSMITTSYNTLHAHVHFFVLKNEFTCPLSAALIRANNVRGGLNNKDRGFVVRK